MPNCYVSFPQVVACWGAVGRHHRAQGTWSAALGAALVPVTAFEDDYGMGWETRDHLQVRQVAIVAC